MFRKFAILLSVALGAGLLWAIVPEDRLAVGAKADRVVVVKSLRTLTLLRSGLELKIYTLALGTNPLGPKLQEGDRKTPEGTYMIDRRNPRSSFHLSLHVSYPDARDQALAETKNVSPGGDIMIHGLRNGLGWLGKSHRLFDWTAGCMAVTNPEIEEIWEAVPDGTPIEIRP